MPILGGGANILGGLPGLGGHTYKGEWITEQKRRELQQQAIGQTGDHYIDLFNLGYVEPLRGGKEPTRQASQPTTTALAPEAPTASTYTAPTALAPQGRTDTPRRTLTAFLGPTQGVHTTALGRRDGGAHRSDRPADPNRKMLQRRRAA